MADKLESPWRVVDSRLPAVEVLDWPKHSRTTDQERKMNVADTLTLEQVEAFYYEHHIPGHELEQWAIEENRVLAYMRDLALAQIEQNSAAHEARDLHLGTLEGQAGTPATSPASAEPHCNWPHEKCAAIYGPMNSAAQVPDSASVGAGVSNSSPVITPDVAEPHTERRAVARVEESEQQANESGGDSGLTGSVPAVSDHAERNQQQWHEQPTRKSEQQAERTHVGVGNASGAKTTAAPAVSDVARLVQRLRTDAVMNCLQGTGALEHEAAALIENLWQLNVEACEEDTACRKLLAAYDTSDSYGVVPLEELIERLLGKCAALEANLSKQEDAERDAARLDALQAMTTGYGIGWVLRKSEHGRGMRLHETGSGTAFATVRLAIDRFIEAMRK